MKKNSKIIVSIVGITIVLLALLGLTYAYYLTRIEGNTNTNSISVTTADLKLVYSENSPEIITENNTTNPPINKVILIEFEILVPMIPPKFEKEILSFEFI